MKYLASCAVLLLFLGAGNAADVQTKHFIVTAQSEEIAKKAGERAEKLRKELSEAWLGKELPAWRARCRMDLTVGDDLPPSGWTSFTLESGEVILSITMTGTESMVMDNIMAHEITHSIIYSYFKSGIPRWADEGGCILGETDRIKKDHDRRVKKLIEDGRLIPLKDLIPMRNYPPERIRLYSQGYSLSEFLVEKGDRKKLLAFIKDGMKDEDWARAVKDSYGYESIAALEKAWLGWFEKRQAAAEKKEAERKKAAEEKEAQKKEAEARK